MSLEKILAFLKSTPEQRAADAEARKRVKEFQNTLDVEQGTVVHAARAKNGNLIAFTESFSDSSMFRVASINYAAYNLEYANEEAGSVIVTPEQSPFKEFERRRLFSTSVYTEHSGIGIVPHLLWLVYCTLNKDKSIHYVSFSEEGNERLRPGYEARGYLPLSEERKELFAPKNPYPVLIRDFKEHPLRYAERRPPKGSIIL